MSRDRVVIANKTYTGDTLLEGRCFIANSIVGDELAIDTLDVEVRSTSSLAELAYGTPAMYYHGDTLIGKFYLESVKHTGREKYSLSCVSAVGLLENATMHYGGLYTTQSGDTVGSVLKDIIGEIVPYTITNGLSIVPVYGWLPVQSRRDALRQLLFATGAAVKKTVAGELDITMLSIGTLKPISDDRLYDNGTVEYPETVSKVTVVEHTYLTGSEQVTLYEDSVSAVPLVSPKGVSRNGVLVTFDEPMHSLTVAGASILESGANYAILSSSASAVLKGKKYIHQTREVHAAVEGATGEDKEARVDDVTIINFVNSEAVAKRVAQFYSLSRTIRLEMVVGDERPGDAVSLNDPFGENDVALLMSQDINMSNTLAAQAEFVAGYTPRNDGVYEHAVVITTGGKWNIPSGVTNIRAVLIGGGQGGQKGADGAAGENGKSCTISPNASYFTETADGGAGGAGGSGGAGGAGGKIKIVTVDVPSGVTSATISIGGGGAGSTVDGQIGSDGWPTTIKLGSTTYSSDDGESAKGGFVNLMTGQLFGIKGSTGAGGADGGAGVVGKQADEDDAFATGDTTAIGEVGGSIPPNNGGTGGTGNYKTGGSVITGYNSVSGGYHPGAGPSYSRNTTLSKPTKAILNQRTGLYELSNIRNYTIPALGTSVFFSWMEVSADGKTLYDCSINCGKTVEKPTRSYRMYQSKAVVGIAYGKGLGGGGGGGAAVSNNGGAASVNNGGAGAAGTKPSTPTTRGAGGTGGSGGGGGGGSYLSTQTTITSSYTCDGGPGGSGGAGGPGGNGAPGCVIIYY